MELEKIGILDPEGDNLNPLTGKEYSNNYKFQATVGNKNNGGWSNLPMYKNKEHPPESIIKDIIDNRVLIIEAGTGNGKSVLVPKYALHAINYEGKVVVTNPKRLPTKNNAAFAAFLLDVQLGKEVGFQHQGSELPNGKPSKSEDTKLLFSTDGTVAEVLKKNPLGTDYDIVIIDEAHERNTRIDLILLQMKNALRKNPNLKLIIMSATLPEGLFYNYYKEFKPKQIFLAAIPNYEVVKYYSEKKIKSNDVEKESVRVLFEEIILKDKPGDVLIFTTTLPKGAEICRMIEQRQKTEKILCIPLSADVEDEETRKNATDKFDPNKLYFGKKYDRKVVVGTNQVESSVTVDGIVYVIDNGLSIDVSWDPKKMEKVIKSEVISAAAATQRAGRAGRTEPGECYRLYTEEQFENFDPDPILEIKKERAEELILDMFSYEEVKTLEDAVKMTTQLIEPPPENFIVSAIRTLYALNLISGLDLESSITNTGRKVLYSKKIVNDLELGCVLNASVDYECSWEMSAIMAILTEKKISIDRLLKQPLDKKEMKKFKDKTKKFIHLDGDIMTMFNIYSKFYVNVKKKTTKLLKQFWEENYLNYYILRNIRKEHINIYRKSQKLRPYREDVQLYDIKTNILMSFLQGYYINIAQKVNSTKRYKNWFPLQKGQGVPEETTIPKSTKYLFYLEKAFIGGSSKYKICNRITVNTLEKIKNNFVFPIKFDRMRSSKRKNSKAIKFKKKRIKK